jgi:anthranilate 1,2-dioxygenase (deaminating, decarboxylating) small subunit
MSSERQQSVEQFLYRKAELCDRRNWVDYLELFDESSEFHIPQWDSEHVYTTDPKRGMSMIYYANRSGLEDRVFRIGTGKSAASTPLPRTLHMVSNVTIQQVSDAQLQAKAKWVTYVHRFGKSSHFFGEATIKVGVALDVSGPFMPAPAPRHAMGLRWPSSNWAASWAASPQNLCRPTWRAAPTRPSSW